MELLIVALLVPGCTVYAAWKLMPAGVKRRLAVALLRLPHLPGPVEAGLRRGAQAASGCGCDGCDHADTKPAALKASWAPGRRVSEEAAGVVVACCMEEGLPEGSG